MNAVTVKSTTFDLDLLEAGKAVRVTNTLENTAVDCLLKRVEPLKLALLYCEDRIARNFTIYVSDVENGSYKVEVL